MDAREFFGAATVARRSSQAGDPVLFEPEGTEPGQESWEITGVSYEEDLAGVIVIRGHRVPAAGSA